MSDFKASKVTTLKQLDDAEFSRLAELFEVKYDLEKHSFGSDKLKVYIEDGYVCMDGVRADPVLTCAATVYLEAMADFAKQTTRVNHRKRASDRGSEKYSFRIWLNRIGLSGPAYKAVRKALLKNLTGSASYAGKEKNDG